MLPKAATENAVMSHDLSPENEAYLNELVASQAFPDRTAALDEAVRVFRRRQTLLGQLAAGVEQLDRGQSVIYGPDEIERFVSDVRARALC